MAEGFFDFQQRLAKEKSDLRKGKNAGGAAKDPPEKSAALTVTQLTSLIEKAIKTGLPASVVVRGEASNVSNRQASGHIYFTLKDDGACLNCVMWRDAATKLKFKVEDGMEMIATGRVSLYAPQGRYQLVATSLQPVGQGALELAFRQLRAKLEAEGLFAARRKKPVPLYPLRIAMITSRATAALQDMLKVLRRYSWLKLMLYHVPVQGEAAGAEIARAISHLNACCDSVGGVEAILLARGGGSLEDLWAFNEEIVARAVATSRIPIVTGIGHEVDCSIADLVADHHAHTPTEAAQFVTQHWKQATEVLTFSRARLNRAARQNLTDARQRLAAIERHELFRRPMDRVNLLRQLLDDRQRALTHALAESARRQQHKLAKSEARLQHFHPSHVLNLGRQRLESAGSGLAKLITSSLQARQTNLENLHRQLQALSPKAVLHRGYSITTVKKTGAIVRNISQLKPGDRLLTRLADGDAESIVQDSRQLSLFE